MKKISLQFALVIAGLLVVITSQADNTINLATLNSADHIVAPSYMLAKLEPAVIDANGQMQLDRADLAPVSNTGENETSNGSGGALFAVILIPLIIYGLFVSLRNGVRRTYIDAYPLPDQVLQNFRRQYPLLDAGQVHRVVKALKLYFCCCVPSPIKRVPMPSRLVNDLWRVFSLQSEDYDVFCQQAFRYKLPYRHIEIQSSKDCDWSVIWQYACSRENQDSFTPKRLPSIFAIDSYFKIEGGLHYELTTCAKKWGLDPANCG